MRLAISTTTAMHSARNIDLPPAAPRVVAAARTCGEASLAREENRELTPRYQSLGRSLYFLDSRQMPASPDVMPEGRIAAAYDEHSEAMWFIALKFRIPAADVLPIIHDVFVAFMRHEETIGSIRSWLIAATCNACRNYWRDRKTGEPVLDDLPSPQVLADQVQASVDVARVLARVRGPCRTVLRLKYVFGLEAEEIALRCATSNSPGYGRQMVHRCLKAARAALASISRA